MPSHFQLSSRKQPRPSPQKLLHYLQQCVPQDLNTPSHQPTSPSPAKAGSSYPPTSVSTASKTTHPTSPSPSSSPLLSSSVCSAPASSTHQTLTTISPPPPSASMPSNAPSRAKSRLTTTSHAHRRTSAYRFPLALFPTSSNGVCTGLICSAYVRRLRQTPAVEHRSGITMSGRIASGGVAS